MPEHVLVVTVDQSRRQNLLRILSDAGYDARGAATFREAKRLLDTEAPELVIADERLGDFNGLHIAILGRTRAPHVRTIVVSQQKDPGLENEARRLHVPCLVAPTNPAEWLASIAEALDSEGTPVPSHPCSIAVH